MTDSGIAVASRLLHGIGPPDRDRAAEILAGCPTVTVAAGEPHFPASFVRTAWLVVEEGLIVVRTGAPGLPRTIIAGEAGPGRVLLPPSGDEVLCGLVPSQLTAITHEARERLIRVRGAADALLDQLELTLHACQETIANFANPRHVERLRLRLLQLARTYGRVAHDGIRIDFPVSHTLLGEMTGSTRETVTRSIDELERSGFVERRGHTYRLLVSPEQVLADASDEPWRVGSEL
jgi:biotin operon repressor